jgi:hypothetical protein
VFFPESERPSFILLQNWVYQQEVLGRINGLLSFHYNLIRHGNTKRLLRPRVILLLRVQSQPRKRVDRAVAYQRPSPLAPPFGFQ